MKKIILISFLLQIVFSEYSYSQFTGYYGTIYKRPAYDGTGTIMALGDQNSDGYDDFLICTGKYQLDTLYTFYFFHGGPVIDTIPYFQFSLPFRTTTGPRVIIAPDINKDGFKDIIISVVRVNPVGGVLLVYYGGPILDSIPDQIVNQPVGDGASVGWAVGTTLIRDFDGDGNQELACFDPMTRYSGNQEWGTIYFHRISNGIIDSIPFKMLEGSQTDSIRITKILSHDINRDGLADFIIRKTKYLKNWYWGYRELLVYIGNSSWDVSTFTQSIRRDNQQDIINLSYYTFYHDINLDGKTDVITEYVGDPYYHKGALLKGGFPVDTTIWKTLNTLNIYITTEIAEDFDANGDGVPDLLMKMYGLASHDTYLWLGSSNFQQYPTKTWYAQEYDEGVRSGNIGDVNGDGADDIYIGVADGSNTHIYPGKVHIYLGDTSVHVPITRVDEKDNEKPESYELLTVHPNPFNPETVISYKLPVNSFVTLKVYDVLGREIAELVNEEQRPGKYKVNFSGKNLASGVYIVQYSYIQGDGLNVIKSLKIELVK